MTKWQVTLIDPNNRHKPISCIVMADAKIEAVNKGLLKICQKRRWRNSDRIREGYTVARAREYDKAEIDHKNAMNYAWIMHEKYKSGEWERPKK